MEDQTFRVVGAVTIDGERQEREMVIAPPPGKGGAWALTEVVRHLNFIADDGTEHHGVWCYFVRRGNGATGAGRPATPVGAEAGQLAVRGQLHTEEEQGTLKKIKLRIPRVSVRSRKAAEKRAALIKAARDALDGPSPSERRIRSQSNGDNR